MSEIIVGIDDSAGARDALAFAERLAKATGASVRLATAFNYSDVPSRASNERFREILRSDAQALLDAAAASSDQDVSATDAIADPSPAHALHALAGNRDAALVVVGSTGRGAVGRVVPGSTGERLLHGSPCPVAIVPLGYADVGAIRSIGVGHDGSDESGAALAAAVELARQFDATLRVIRVFDATRVGTPGLMTMPGWESMHEDHEATERESLKQTVSALPADLPVESVFINGNAGTELPGESEHVDLMMVGSRGYGPRAAVLLGGVTHALLRTAACPVIVLPRGSRGLDGLFATAAETAAR
jgi:nucleotide-binding universal stress UspA family protein